MSHYKEDIFANIYPMLREKGFGEDDPIWSELEGIKYLFDYSVGKYNHEQKQVSKKETVKEDGYNPSFRAISKGWTFGDDEFDVAEFPVIDRAFCLKVDSAVTDEDMDYLYRFYMVLNRLSEINIDTLESLESLIQKGEIK